MIVKLPTTTTTRRLPGLDGIRGLAVIAVIAHHFAHDRLPWLHGRGAYGVEVFFVLSGFLITTLLLQEESRFGGVSLRRFYSRRFARIYPVLIVYLATLFVLSRFGVLMFPLRDGAASLLMVRNFLGQSCVQTTHLWTLAIEGQFYAVWPLLFVSLGTARARLVCCATVVVVSRLCWHFHIGYDPADFWSQFATHLRIEPLAVGSAAAIVTYARAPARRLVEASAVSAAVVLAVVLFTPLGVATIGPTIGFMAVAAIVYAACDGRTAAARALSFPPLVAVGLVSYSAYVWHHLFAFSAAANWPAMLLGTGVVGCTLASYFLIERPFQGLSRRHAA